MRVLRYIQTTLRFVKAGKNEGEVQKQANPFDQHETFEWLDTFLCVKMYLEYF